LQDLSESLSLIDRAVRKENKRRNIHLDGDIYQAQLFNFSPNLSFSHILEIYGLDLELVQAFKGSKNVDEMMVDSQFEEMSTFPQTYDAQLSLNMDFDMHVPEDDGLELRRR
jgi:hypothetical protein